MIDLLVDGLAAYRLTRLLRQDTITDPMRDWIEARSVKVQAYRPECSPECEARGHELAVRDVQPWAFVRDMLDCPWCASVWCAIFIVGVRRVPGGRLLRNVLAVAALAGVAGFADDHLTGVLHDIEHDEPVGTAQMGGDP